ncbi:MAG TPA: hypothetical protein VFQ21_08535 [Gemmatimonadota bacterium]|nr:hypothetical protein [Gemmatimonadota bacterium]
MERRTGAPVGVASVQAQVHVCEQVPRRRIVRRRGERVLERLARIKEPVVEEQICFRERAVAGTRGIAVTDRALEVAASRPRVPARQLGLTGGEGLRPPLLCLGVGGA